MRESDERKLLVCFGLAVLHHYRESIVAVRGRQTVSEFRERNPEVVHKIHEEAIRLLNYQLDDIFHVDSAIELYLRKPQRVEPTSTPFSIP